MKLTLEQAIKIVKAAIPENFKDEIPLLIHRVAAMFAAMQQAQATIAELESRLHHLGETANKQAAEIEQQG